MEGVEVVLGLWTIGQKVTDKTLAEGFTGRAWYTGQDPGCLLYTSDAADDYLEV